MTPTVPVEAALASRLAQAVNLLLRRFKLEPSLLDAVLECQAAGAHGITIHLREDRRHIQDADLFAIRAMPGGRDSLPCSKRCARGGERGSGGAFARVL